MGGSLPFPILFSCDVFSKCPTPSGPMMALCLAREDAVEKWRDMLGPKELEVAKQQAPARYRPHSLRALHVDMVNALVFMIVCIMLF